MKPIYYITIIPLIALIIGVTHKRPEWYQTRSQARWERKEARGYSNGWWREGRNWKLERGNLSH